MKTPIFSIFLITVLFFGCGSHEHKPTTKEPEKNPVIELKQGTDLLAQRHCAEAAKVYEGFLVKYPLDAGGWNLLGLSYLCDSKPELAIAPMRKALELNPSFTDVHNNLGVVYMEMKNFPEARAEFLKALEDPQYPASAPYFNLAKLAFNQGSYEESRALSKKVVEFSPKEQGPRVLYALSLEKLGRYPEALVSLQETEKMAPGNVEVAFHLGSVLVHLGKPCEARPYLARVLDEDPLGELGQQSIALMKQAQCKP